VHKKNVFVVISAWDAIIRTSTLHQKLNKFHSGSVFSKLEVLIRVLNFFTKNLTESTDLVDSYCIASYGPVKFSQVVIALPVRITRPVTRILYSPGRALKSEKSLYE
jgi:hypothetical protein